MFLNSGGILWQKTGFTESCIVHYKSTSNFVFLELYQHIIILFSNFPPINTNFLLLNLHAQFLLISPAYLRIISTEYMCICQTSS
jgi:hypothetical protein